MFGGVMPNVVILSVARALPGQRVGVRFAVVS